jgi:recombination protein RecA
MIRKAFLERVFAPAGFALEVLYGSSQILNGRGLDGRAVRDDGAGFGIDFQGRIAARTLHLKKYADFRHFFMVAGIVKTNRLPFDLRSFEAMDERERARALELTLGQIEKQFGKGSILRLGAKDAVVPISVISTGSIGVDAALGIGGFPRGRISEIYGPESSGKTTIALQVVAEAQRHGGMAAFIDVEHALDPIYARKLGVDVDNLLVSQPDYGEQALEITSALVTSGSIDVLVVDSVAALVPKAELDGEMGDSHMGLQARLMSQALRKLTGIVSKSKTCLIFINQIRDKIGVMFGSPETTTGGRALKFYSSVRIDIRRIAAIKDGDSVTGNRTKVKIVKNKLASPFREAEFDIIYGEGISKEGDLIDLGVAQNVIEKSGSWFSYKGDRIGQGRENARQFLKDNVDIRAAVDTELRKLLGLIKPEPVNGAPAPDVAPPVVKQSASAARGR